MKAWELIHGDCLDPVSGLASLADKSVDHVICDPPYSLTVVTSTKRAPSISASNPIGSATRRDLGYQGIDPAQRVAAAMEIGRICRRWAIVFCDAESLTSWRVNLEASGLRHVRMGAWVMPNCTPQFTGDRPGTGWEACEIAHGTGRSRWNGRGLPAVWIVPRPSNGSPEREATGHPTPKPIPLLEALVRDFTDPGDLICDPFAGSATTGVAAVHLGRRFIGWEKDANYYQIARDRLAATREQFNLFQESTL